MTARLRLLPLWVALPYLLITWLLFLVGPYVWPVRAWWAIWIYIPVAFACLAFGFTHGSKGEPRGEGMPKAKWLFYVGSIGALLLLIPTTLTYTGKLPWALGGALDQREAYAALADQLAATAGGRGPIALLRALLGPFVFCVIPMAVLLWKTPNQRMTWLERALAIATGIIAIDLSLLRGTTAQLADLLIVIASAVLIRLTLHSRGAGLTAVFRHWKLALSGAVLLSMVVLVLVGRTEARLGGRNIGCIERSGVCADLSTGAYGRMPESVAFGAAAVSGYFSQGYYGVALAAEKPWLPTWGAGHSPVAGTLFVMFGGKEQFLNRTYTSRARAEGWPDDTQWSSLITWLANDASLWGALALLWGLGWLWGRTWIDASQAGDLRAAVLFCVLSMVIFYLPANNYVMGTYDAYATLIVWWVLWGWGRGRRSSSEAYARSL
ncbi:hypothetical protein [Sphingomonas crusticola]|uniref:hypothetical protein n=1 Tax=Sphingomonas crusticola TaxID=1697973 RepID=UPI000E252488|nr:hypothetical protein [Sphingomonas crusticola]